MPHATPSAARRLIDAVPVWDHHACMPLRPQDTSFLPQLARHKAAGFDAITVNLSLIHI
jgi:membrane dipeptidase